MKKKIFILLLCVVLIATCILCGVTGIFGNDSQNSPKPQTPDTAVTENMTFPSKVDSLTLKVGESKLIELSSEKAKSVTKWTSSDSKIVTVDDGGRVDALKEGTALISAISKDKSKSEFQVTVAKSTTKKQQSYSTCITANLDKLESNKRNTAKNLYAIKVNRTANCVTVYTYDEKGKYTIPVRAMICSTGLDNSTITGDYTIGIKSEWLSLVGDVFGRYISGISGDYLFHSVPYYSISEEDLELEEFNKLGEQASQGCVRLAVSDAKWVYDNCPTGTNVSIYDDAENAGLLSAFAFEAIPPLEFPEYSIFCVDFRFALFLILESAPCCPCCSACIPNIFSYREGPFFFFFFAAFSRLFSIILSISA